MSHDHHHHPIHPHHGSANIGWAFFLNLGFAIIEIIGGFLTNSLSILSDAVHDLGDSLALGFAWYFQRLSGRRGDAKYTYGYQRFNVIGALLSSVILIAGSIFIISEAIPRLWDPSPVESRGMFLLAILGILVNGLAVFKLRKGESLNEKVVSLHLVQDMLGWVAVLIGAIIIYFTGWYIIDPILSIGIAAYICIQVIKNFGKSIRIILQRVPDGMVYQDVLQQLQDIPSVRGVHDVHIWTMDGQKNVLTAHLVLNDLSDAEANARIRSEAKARMAVLGIAHCTIELESVDEDCDVDCL